MKKVGSILITMCAVALTACAGNEVVNTEDDSKVSSITINKDGSVESTIVEDFSQDYYDVEELKTMIEDAVAEYKSQDSSAKVSLKKCERQADIVNVVMEYGDYKAYTGFNEETFFVGTIKDAYEAGYDLDYTLHAVSDKTKKKEITKNDLISMGDYNITIIENFGVDERLEETTKLRVNCYDDILYVGDGVSISDKNSADIILSNDKKVIVFK